MFLTAGLHLDISCSIEVISSEKTISFKLSQTTTDITPAKQNVDPILAGCLVIVADEGPASIQH